MTLVARVTRDRGPASGHLVWPLGSHELGSDEARTVSGGLISIGCGCLVSETSAWQQARCCGWSSI